MSTEVNTNGYLYNNGMSSGFFLNNYAAQNGLYDSWNGASVFESPGGGAMNCGLNPMFNMGMCNPMFNMGMCNPMMFNPVYWNSINQQIQSSNIDFQQDINRRTGNNATENSWINDVTNFQIGIKDQVFEQQIKDMQDAIKNNRMNLALKKYSDLYTQVQQKYSGQITTEGRLDSDKSIRTTICSLYKSYTGGSDLYNDVKTYCKGASAEGLHQGAMWYGDNECNTYYNEQVVAIMKGDDPNTIQGHENKEKTQKVAKAVGKYVGPISGIASGAAIGACFGGFVGALIGAGVGAVAGVIGQGVYVFSKS